MAEVKTFPMLPMRDIVVFPLMTTPFFIGRKQSMAALENALAADRMVFVIAQKDPMVEQPSADDLYEIGTVGHILQIMRLPNGTIKALFEAKQRAKLISTDMESDSYTSVVELIEEVPDTDPEMAALAKTTKSELESYLKEIKRNTESIDQSAIDSESPHLLADRISPLLNLDLQKKQELLEILSPRKRLERVVERMIEEAEIKKLPRTKKLLLVKNSSTRCPEC